MAKTPTHPLLKKGADTSELEAKTADLIKTLSWFDDNRIAVNLTPNATGWTIDLRFYGPPA